DPEGWLLQRPPSYFPGPYGSRQNLSIRESSGRNSEQDLSVDASLQQSDHLSLQTQRAPEAQQGEAQRPRSACPFSASPSQQGHPRRSIISVLRLQHLPDGYDWNPPTLPRIHWGPSSLPFEH
ncbi:hypothetical protein LTR16_012162, partial [Cryomyces antarcticus]